jgi:hypothetical protein
MLAEHRPGGERRRPDHLLAEQAPPPVALDRRAELRLGAPVEVAPLLQALPQVQHAPG